MTKNKLDLHVQIRKDGFECSSCGEIIPTNTKRKNVWEKVLQKAKENGQIKDCAACDHNVLVCEDCIDAQCPICPECLNPPDSE